MNAKYEDLFKNVDDTLSSLVEMLKSVMNEVYVEHPEAKEYFEDIMKNGKDLNIEDVLKDAANWDSVKNKK